MDTLSAPLQATSEASAPGEPRTEIARTAQFASAGAPPRLSLETRALVGDLLASVSDGDDGVIEVTLDPPELGRVRISYTVGADGVSARIVAGDPSTLELLRRHGEALAQDLREAGFESVDLDFQRESAGGERRPNDRAFGLASAQEPDHSASPPSATILPADGLDLRI